MCESRGGRPGLPVLIPYGICGRKATLNFNMSCVKVEVDVLGSLSLMHNGPYGLCGRKAILNFNRSCVKVEVDVLGSPVHNSPLLSLWT